MTAQQVEDGSATLRDFALAGRDRYRTPISTLEGSRYFQCLVRQEGSPWRSGSTYLVQLTPDGRVYEHAKSMALSGRLLNPLIYAEILSALGVSPTDLANLASPDPATAGQAFGAVMGTLSQEPDAAFDATTPIPDLRPGIPGASGHAAVFLLGDSGRPVVLLTGFDLGESHLIPISDEGLDYGNPAITARDVVDRETLKAFVTQAGEWFVSLLETATDPAAISKARIALRDPNGPWRYGPVYLYVLDLTSNTILFHGAFPDRFEGRPLVATLRDVAANSSPEGGFLEYYFDDPTDDTDSADIPKVGYARPFTATVGRPDGTALTIDLIVGSGFFGSGPETPEVVTDGPSTEVEVTLLGNAVEGLTVEFSRAIAGRSRHFAWNAITDAAGQASLTISGGRQVSGFYQARARNDAGEIVGQWHSIPLNRNRRQVLELTLGGGMRIVRVEPPTAAKAAASAGGLAPNSPNPFNSATQISYHLSSSGPVRLVIYNVLGQPVRTLVDEYQSVGSYRIQWDARDQQGAALSSGIYITRLSYPGGVLTRRLLYLK